MWLIPCLLHLWSEVVITPVEWSYLNTDMRKFETSQKEESRAQSTDSSKAYRKPSRAALLNRWAAAHWWAAKLLQVGREMFRDNAIIAPSRNNYA